MPQKKKVSRVAKPRFGLLILLILAVAIPLTIIMAQSRQDQQTLALETGDSFSFTAAGDHGLGSLMRDTRAVMRNSGASFHLALGDFSYNNKKEKQWCRAMRSPEFRNVFLIAGNHDTGETQKAKLAPYLNYCPFTLPNMTGRYGVQYYFDYPQAGTPLARFIMVTPGVGGSLTSRYKPGEEGYTFTQNAIDDARAQNIPWVIVGMHKNCISMGGKPCDIGQEFFDMLFEKNVDLILQAHEHNYQRSHLLTCGTYQLFRQECIMDDGRDGAYVKTGNGPGTLLVISGMYGRPDVTKINPNDPEAGYFAASDQSTWGLEKLTVTAQTITGEFLQSRGSFQDTFTFTKIPQAQ